MPLLFIFKEVAMQFTIFTANCTGKRQNCSYPKRVSVTDEISLKAAVAYDHVCAGYRENHRSVDNFISSDCLVMDLDNDHTEDPSLWITPEKLIELIPDVDFMMAASRHHMLAKDGKAARPRYHVYFPIEECLSAERYSAMKVALQRKFSFFDGNAVDAARFIFGCDCESVVVNEGWVSIDEEIDLVDEDTASNEPDPGVISQGSRNNTMSHFAGRVLKRFGVTEKAKNAFLEICDPDATSMRL